MAFLKITEESLYCFSLRFPNLNALNFKCRLSKKTLALATD